MDHASRGAAALAAGDAWTAISAYTQALIEHPTSPDYFIQRSTALNRLKAPVSQVAQGEACESQLQASREQLQQQHELALLDAEYAVLLGQKRARREKIQAAQQRRVIALYTMERYADAGFVLKTMERWRSKERKDEMEGLLWKGKIEQSLDKLPQENGSKATAAEYPDVELPSESTLRKMLKAQLDDKGIFKLPTVSTAKEGNNITVGAVNSSTTTEFSSDLTGADAAQAPTDAIKVERETEISYGEPDQQAQLLNIKPAPSNVRHEWFQNAQSVTITFYAKGVVKEQADIEINTDSLSISFPHPSNLSSTFDWTLDPLFAPVDAVASTYKVLSTKVEVVLRKARPGQKWATLEREASSRGDGHASTCVKPDPTNTTASVMPVSARITESVPSYPTSSRSGPKDWDKVAADLTTKQRKEKKVKLHGATNSEDQKAKDPGGNSGSEDDQGGNNEDDEVDSDFGGDPVDSFFKKLYAGADADTRRAMMKSYQESAGTALSTNWSDVGKREVVPVESKSD